jgi:hypothetical protein
MEAVGSQCRKPGFFSSKLLPLFRLEAVLARGMVKDHASSVSEQAIIYCQNFCLVNPLSLQSIQQRLTSSWLVPKELSS